MNSENDQELVKRILDGETHVFSILVRRYERPVYNMMFRYCRDRQEAADLTQDVFLRTYERLDSFDRRRKFFSWLYTLAINRARDWHRRSRRIRSGLNELQWSIPDVENSSRQEKKFLEKEEAAALYSALETLPDETRELVLMRYQYDLSIRELSTIFGLSESAVKMRIARALQKLRGEFAEERNEV
ncbi:DNA-directed RNA polymerase sigma-70 factor [Desulfomarina profundi]|uniref:DNA-directed RNA polymerase sigma-70 factor n=1 Tax=Desulfomarina profundi TaxID=2772557 RepID=A0A8D5FKJ6_9BACT|nr:RNA polymerase sigma factor [Desulfomarina profundi]BCL63073.1 DNA-directed RNA polymerase sigma-70 factor [Desulfomarina profundi]